MTIPKSTFPLLQEAQRERTLVYLSGDGIDITFETRIQKVDSERLIVENPVRPQYIHRMRNSERFSMLVKMVRFQTDKIESDGQNIVFPLKAMTVLEETRQSERFPFTAEERVVCEVLNPFDRETRVTKSLMDMSATGLSLRTRFESRLFKPGVTLPEIRVLIDGRPYSQSRGQVVYTRKLMDYRGKLRLQVGVKFDEPLK